MNKVLLVLIGLAMMVSILLWFLPDLVGNRVAMQEVLEPGPQSINRATKVDARLAITKTEHQKKLEPQREASDKSSNGTNIAQYLTSSIVYTSTPFAVIRNTLDNSIVTVRPGDTLQSGLHIVGITRRSVVVEQGGKPVALQQEEINNSTTMPAIQKQDNAGYALNMDNFVGETLDQKIASIMNENPTGPMIDMSKFVGEDRSNLLVDQMNLQ